MKNVAILNIRNMKKSAGGPSGYLYNLYAGFESNKELVPPDFIYCFDEVSNNSNDSNKRNVKDLLPGIRYILYYLKQGLRIKKILKKKVEKYDCIHVHTGEAVVYLRKFCRYKGKIIFTPHRPESVRKEIIANLRKKKKGNYTLVGMLLDISEKLSYKYSDYFIFPCREAMNIYRAFPGFEKYSTGKKIEYVYTGIEKKKPTIQMAEYRNKEGIPEDSFVLGYIGRHNSIKGYDRLVNLSSQLEKENIYVLVAGNYELERVPNTGKWIEKGYINDSENLINACDAIVVPNRNTYFDLVILEALSHGKIVITTNTGGNINLANETDGIYLFNNTIGEKDLMNKILSLRDESRDIKLEMERDALLFFENNCTCDRFAANYYNALLSLIG